MSRIAEDVAAEAKPAVAGQEKRIGDYRIVREIGRGAMGAVFEAVQESLGRRVALKVLPGSFALEPKRVERFLREARAPLGSDSPCRQLEISTIDSTALLVNAYPLGPGATNALIIGLAAFCTLVWAGIVFIPNRGAACIMVLLAGVAFGPTFPTVIGVLTGHVHPAVTGRAVGLFFVVGGIGWSVIPILIGAYARKKGVQRAFVITMACAAGLTLTAAALRPFMG